MAQLFDHYTQRTSLYIKQQTTTLQPQATAEKSLSTDLSVSEVEDFLYRLRWLFDKSSYHEQILLIQTAPIE
jgi:hypothetical protein